MPKSRGSNTIGTRGRGSSSVRSLSSSGGGAGTVGDFFQDQSSGAIEETEMPQRLEDRLNEVRTVTVGVESRTRRRTEEVQVTFDPQNQGFAQVESESGATYQVDYNNGTCDCMHYRMRNDGCRHIDATNQAIGQILGNRSVSNLRNGQGLSDQEAAVAISGQVRSDAQAEIERRALTAEYQDDGYFYSDHPEEFRNILQGINSDIPYEYENVLNGSQVTFGIELEFVGGNADRIARELYDLGICAYDRRVGYHSPGVPGKWRLERDGSVSSGDMGGELVSPVLKDSPETWSTIETICEVAKRHGATVNSKTGAHVHIGMDPLDTARQRWKRFFKTINGFEECIYRFSGGDLGRIRSNYSTYATPFSGRSGNAATSRFSMNDMRDVQALASRASNNNRYYGINLTNISSSSKPNTVEFRYFNGSLNPSQIQANVKLANGIVMAAEKARTRDGESDSMIISETMKRRGNMLKDTTQGDNVPDDSKIMKLVDIIFSRKQDKDAALSVFAKNNWRL